MSKRLSGSVAIAIILGMIAVIIAGSGGLPRDLKSHISEEQGQLASAQTRFHTERDRVMQALAAEPELFRAQSMNTLWPERIRKDEAALAEAARDNTQLQQLRQQNKSDSRPRAEALLTSAHRLQDSALSDADDLQASAEHWVSFKKNLPANVRLMQNDYDAVHAADLASTATLVHKAETDWPAKRDALESGLTGVQRLQTDADQSWSSTAAARQQVESGNISGVDVTALAAAAIALQAAKISLVPKAGELKDQASQLYVAKDKILVDQESKDGEYRQKLKTIQTKMVDPATKKNDVTSSETWVAVPKSTYLADERNLGMTVEHKAAGLFDSEADRTAQPPGFAYVAPPGQSNQYGYWDHRDGGSFWTFLPEYLILRSLLSGPSYHPIGIGEYQDYGYAHRYGRPYYGHDAGGQPRYGTAGTETQTRYRDSKYVSGGGYRNSGYASHAESGSGGFRGSAYSSPSSRSGSSAQSSGGYRGSRYSSPSSRSYSRPSHSFSRGGRR